MIRVVLPHHLRNLTGAAHAIEVEVEPPATQDRLVDALEAAYPVLRGTVRDPATMRRRPFIRFFAGGEDLSHDPPGAPLPDSVISGREAFHVVGAMAGG